MSYQSETSTGDSNGNSPMGHARAIGIKTNVLNIYRELSNVAVGVKDYKSKADTEKRLGAAARCRHEILSHLYAGDETGALFAFQALLVFNEDLETESTKAEPFDLVAVTEACLRPPPGQETPKLINLPQTTPEEELFEELLSQYGDALLTSEKLEIASIKPRTKLMGEWFWEGDLGFIYGERGIGKTWLVNAVCVHLSIGRDLDTWPVGKTAPVLYIDGEMPQDTARDRLKGMAANNKNLLILHHERLFELHGLSLNLADPLTQKVLTKLCVDQGIKVLALDNLSCLVSGVKENVADAWEQLLPWLLELRRLRIAVVIVHHAGRSGFMRGTTKREDSASWIIKVAAVEGRDCNEEGAKFNTTFTKIRSTPKPEWSRIWHFNTEANGDVSIGCEEVSNEGRVLQLIQSGLETATDIAEELGCAKSTVSKLARKLEAEKLIDISKRRYSPRGFLDTK